VSETSGTTTSEESGDQHETTQLLSTGKLAIGSLNGMIYRTTST